MFRILRLYLQCNHFGFLLCSAAPWLRERLDLSYHKKSLKVPKRHPRIFCNLNVEWLMFMLISYNYMYGNQLQCQDFCQKIFKNISEYFYENFWHCLDCFRWHDNKMFSGPGVYLQLCWYMAVSEMYPVVRGIKLLRDTRRNAICWGLLSLNCKYVVSDCAIRPLNVLIWHFYDKICSWANLALCSIVYDYSTVKYDCSPLSQNCSNCSRKWPPCCRGIVCINLSLDLGWTPFDSNPLISVISERLSFKGRQC